MTRHGSTSLQAALGADYARQHSTTSFMPCGSGPPVANYPGTRQHQLGTLRGRWACPRSLGFGVDIHETYFDVLGPERHEPPAHHVQAALAGSRVVAEFGVVIGEYQGVVRRGFSGFPIAGGAVDWRVCPGGGTKETTRKTPS